MSSRRARLPLVATVPALAAGGCWAFGQWGWGLALHLASVGLAGWCWGRAVPESPLAGLRATTLTLCFPVIGPIASWLIAPPEARGAGGLAELYRDYIAYDVPEASLLPVADADEAVRRELSVLPLAEVLRSGDLAAKQGAAQALAEREDAGSVATLREALLDPDGETRLFASLGLVRMEEHFTAQLSEARDRAASGEAAALAILAGALRRYAGSGLPELGAAEALWREAADAATRALALKPEARVALAAWLHLAACRKALGDGAGAVAAAESAIDLATDDAEAVTALCETLFEIGELDRIGRVARLLALLAPSGSHASAIAAYWQQEARS